MDANAPLVAVTSGAVAGINRRKWHISRSHSESAFPGAIPQGVTGADWSDAAHT
jgi:hypothetical protein